MIGRVAVMTVACFGVLGISALSSGNASTLGGMESASLLALSAPASVSIPTTTTPPTTLPPVLPVCDDFTLPAPSGTALGGRVAQPASSCRPLTWTVRSGTWTTGSDGLMARNANAVATLEAGLQNISAQAVIVGVGQPNRTAGVVVSYGGSPGSYLVALLDGRNTVRLRLISGGSTTNLASATVSIPATASIQLTRSGSSVSVQVGGVTVINHTLSAPRVTTLGAGSGVGVFWSNGNNVRFTSFNATAVP